MAAEQDDYENLGQLKTASLDSKAQELPPPPDLKTARLNDVSARDLSAPKGQSPAQFKSIGDLRPELLRLLYNPAYQVLNNTCTKFEQSTGHSREHLAYGVIAFLSVYLLVGRRAELLANLISLVYPLATMFNGLRTDNLKENKFWLSFWVVAGGLTLLEFWKKSLLRWLPAYWFLKTVFLLYLSAPQTQGALLLKDKLLTSVDQLDKLFESLTK